MKNACVILSIVLFALTLTYSLNAQDDEIILGRVYFPRHFVHADKDYVKGVYKVTFNPAEDNPSFTVMNKKGEVLFKELAVIKPNSSKFKKFKYRVKKEMLKGYEYFRIKVTKPDNHYMGYFMIKKKTEEKKELPPEKKEPE